jgi:hypothetical protein
MTPDGRPPHLVVICSAQPGEVFSTPKVEYPTHSMQFR